VQAAAGMLFSFATTTITTMHARIITDLQMRAD
jgi:hypothetical protein